MKVEQLISDKGYAVPNQFVLSDENAIIFQSCESTICILKNGLITIGKNWDRSVTTSKWLYLFLRDYQGMNIHSKKDIEKAIKNDDIIYDSGLV